MSMAEGEPFVCAFRGHRLFCLTLFAMFPFPVQTGRVYQRAEGKRQRIVSNSVLSQQPRRGAEWK